ncbi:cyclic pyranopterin monophosphate synthase MoaC [Omnitrophica bacterium]|nr:cyclic pyranopterin monophosphate synthase MoaC [Candidatus Omnitrophota bacterium]
MKSQKSQVTSHKLKPEVKKLEGMIDVSGKEETERVAKAQVFIKLKKEIVRRIKEQKILKGDVLEQARAAGILAAKKTPDLIPMCHPLRLSEVSISFEVVEGGIRVASRVSAVERTGVEMEALTACCIAALTIYDMCKMYDRSIEITDLMLIKKRGGKSGAFERAKRKERDG